MAPQAVDRSDKVMLGWLQDWSGVMYRLPQTTAGGAIGTGTPSPSRLGALRLEGAALAPVNVPRHAWRGGRAVHQRRCARCGAH